MKPRSLVLATAFWTISGRSGTPTATAAQSAATPTDDLRLVEAAQRQDLEAVRVLLGEQAAVDRPQADGATPLMLASTNGSTPMIDTLLQAGDDAAVARPTGETALMMAKTCSRVMPPTTAQTAP